MNYYMKRFRHGISKIHRWLPLVFLPSLVYLIIAASTPDRFLVSQLVNVNPASPIALSRTPIDIISIKDIAANPDGLFLDDFAVLDLSRMLSKSANFEHATLVSSQFRSVLETNMAIKTSGDHQIRISYYGNDLELGQTLVAFYTQRLIIRSREGIARQIRQQRIHLSDAAMIRSASLKDTDRNATGIQLQPADPAGEMLIQKEKAFFRSSRFMTAGILFALSLVLVGIAALVLELMDPTFKSERQVARYMNLPVLGSIPNLDQLIQRIPKPVSTK